MSINQIRICNVSLHNNRTFFRHLIHLANHLIEWENLPSMISRRKFKRLTRMPCPRALAGWNNSNRMRCDLFNQVRTGLIIHFDSLLSAVSSKTRLNKRKSAGKTKVWGTKSNSRRECTACMCDRFLHSRSFRPIWNEPGKWLIYGENNETTIIYSFCTFWYSRIALKQGGFIWRDHVPSQSTPSAKKKNLFS